MDDRLLALAQSRGGVLTTAQAASVGIDEHGLVRLCRSEELVRVRRCAYVLGSDWRAADDVGQLALRTRAVLASRATTSVASHESALALHRLPVHGEAPEVVDLLADVSRTRLVGGARLHPAGAHAHVVADGYRCVEIATAIAQVVVRAGLVAGLVPLDRALHEGRVTADEVEAAVARVATRPAQQAVGRALLDRADPRCESVAETRTRVLLVDLGFDVRSQVEVRDHGRLVGRVDFLVGDRVVVEFDGMVKYAGADGRDALAAEKRREDELRALGYVVIRLTWADLEHPARIAARVRRALAQTMPRDAGAPAS